MPVLAAGYFRGVSAEISAGAYQHLPEFQPQNFAASGRRVRGCGHRHDAGEVSQLKSAQHLQGPPAVYGEHSKSTGASLEDYSGRSGEPAFDFSAHRLHPAGARQTFPAVPLADSRGDGAAERGHDQTIRAGRCWSVVHQRELCEGLREGRRSEAAERRRRGPLARTRSHLPARSQPAARSTGVDRIDSRTETFRVEHGGGQLGSPKRSCIRGRTTEIRRAEELRKWFYSE